MRPKLLLPCIALLATLPWAARAADAPVASRHTPAAAPAIGVALDTAGRIWLAEVDATGLRVSRSEDDGRHFSTPVPVLAEAENVTADGENRPKIAVGADGIVHLSWTQNLGERMTGNIRYARSTDDGRSYSTPQTLNSDRQRISHRFDALATDGQGKVAVVWLDARARASGPAAGSGKLTQVGLYAAQSSDGGASFAADERVASHTCQCCRTALVFTAGGPLAYWRHVYEPNVRDFALAALAAPAGGTPLRVTDDDWSLDGCPHHGGDIARDGANRLHIVWFTQGRARQGVFYRRLGSPRFDSTGHVTGLEVTTAGPVLSLGDPRRQAGHPAVAAAGARVLLAWREFDGQNYAVWAQLSEDGGEHWSAAQRLAETTTAADYPLPLLDAQRALVVWRSAGEGVRFLSVTGHPAPPAPPAGHQP